MQNYFQKKPSILDGIWYGCEWEEWYNFRVDWKNIWRFLLSWLWKFYFLLHKKDTEQEIEILKYLESLWYEAVSHKNWETALDIVGIFFMPYDAWVEKSKGVYKDLYIDWWWWLPYLWDEWSWLSKGQSKRFWNLLQRKIWRSF